MFLFLHIDPTHILMSPEQLAVVIRQENGTNDTKVPQPGKLLLGFRVFGKYRYTQINNPQSGFLEIGGKPKNP